MARRPRTTNDEKIRQNKRRIAAIEQAIRRGANGKGLSSAPPKAES